MKAVGEEKFRLLEFRYLLSLETYQAAENSTYSDNINSFWVEGFPWDA